jgi:hypothetical protein
VESGTGGKITFAVLLVMSPDVQNLETSAVQGLAFIVQYKVKVMIVVTIEQATVKLL